MTCRNDEAHIVLAEHTNPKNDRAAFESRTLSLISQFGTRARQYISSARNNSARRHRRRRFVSIPRAFVVIQSRRKIVRRGYRSCNVRPEIYSRPVALESGTVFVNPVTVYYGKSIREKNTGDGRLVDSVENVSEGHAIIIITRRKRPFITNRRITRKSFVFVY